MQFEPSVPVFACPAWRRNTRGGLLQPAGSFTGRALPARFPKFVCAKAPRSFAAIHPFASSRRSARRCRYSNGSAEKLSLTMPVYWLRGPEEELNGALHIEGLYALATGFGRRGSSWATIPASPTSRRRWARRCMAFFREHRSARLGTARRIRECDRFESTFCARLNLREIHSHFVRIVEISVTRRSRLTNWLSRCQKASLQNVAFWRLVSQFPDLRRTLPAGMR